MNENLPGYEDAAAMVAAQAARMAAIPPRAERVPLAQAAGRVLARPLSADRDQPPFARSTRDGYACRAAEANAHLPLAVAGSSRAGDAPAGPLPDGCLWEIMTGAPVPRGADAVVMLEHVKRTRGRVQLLPPRTVAVGENIVARAAQARKGEELLAAGELLTFAQMALAASCGQAMLQVYAKPRVAILTTGDEIVPVDEAPGPGKIRNSNAPMLAALVAAAGGDPWLLPTAADNAQALDRALKQALKADLLLITGGVSAGKFDLVESALKRFGARFHFTGARIQPGKPVVFGEAPRASGRAGGKLRPVQCFGLPGNPVSSAVTFLLFAAPMLAALAGRAERGPRFALARLAEGEARHAKSGLTRFLPAHCNFGAAGEPEAAFLSMQGSGDLAALARSNCFIVLPPDSRPLKPGAVVRILLP
jgi:molybdopterin molybdotransferase